MSMIKFPYTNLHELNLDWLIEKVKEAYSPDNPPDMAVLSVNGETGDVILYKEANVQLPDVTDTSWNFFRLADGTAAGIKFNKGLPMERVYGSNRFQVFDTGNPPPYPVRSVNGQTGDITVQVAFGALNGDTVTFLQSSPDHSWSLDRETLDGSASIRLDTTNDEISAYIEYVSSDDTVHSSVKLLTPADIPSSSGVLSVNGAAGVVVITAEDIHRTGSNSETVEHCLSSLTTDTQNLANKIGSVGSTSLQAQVNTINSKIGSVGSTSLQDQVNTINNKIDYGTIINLQQITDTYVTRNTYQNRKFSDYKMLIFTIVMNNWAKISSIVPPYAFANLSGIDIRYQDTSGLVEVDIKYTSDTSFDAKYIGNPTSGVFIYCYGILKN